MSPSESPNSNPGLLTLSYRALCIAYAHQSLRLGKFHHDNPNAIFLSFWLAPLRSLQRQTTDLKPVKARLWSGNPHGQNFNNTATELLGLSLDPAVALAWEFPMATPKSYIWQTQLCLRGCGLREHRNQCKQRKHIPGNQASASALSWQELKQVLKEVKGNTESVTGRWQCWGYVHVCTAYRCLWESRSRSTDTESPSRLGCIFPPCHLLHKLLPKQISKPCNLLITGRILGLWAQLGTCSSFSVWPGGLHPQLATCLLTALRAGWLTSNALPLSPPDSLWYLSALQVRSPAATHLVSLSASQGNV